MKTNHVNGYKRMGKVKKMKKKTTIIIAMMMLVSISLVLVPTTSAENPDPRTVRGYVYIDEEVNTPDQVKILISGQEVTATIPGDPEGYYIIDFDEYVGETGVFHVTIPGGTWEAAETVTIKQGVYIYKINLTIDTSTPPINNAPNTPSSPSPSDGATGRSTGTDLSWTGGDPDGDTVTYDIYFGTTLTLVKNDHTSTSYNLPTLDYETTYQWQIIAEDEHGATATGPVWDFTTKEEDTGGGGGPSGGGDDDEDDDTPSGGGDTNEDPEADAGEPYQGLVGEEIEFDGSGSTDDGTIESYSWNFGDGNTGSGETVSHTYDAAGTYTAVLTVEDDDGATDTDTAMVTILTLNNPPEVSNFIIIPNVTKGHTNGLYQFTIMGSDPDKNDTIQFIFYWGDGTKTTTEFYNTTGPGGSQGYVASIENKTWTTPGTYTINVRAYDGEAYSANETLTIVIETPSQPTEDNGDDDKEDDYTMYYYGLGIIAIIVLLSAAYLATRKKEKKKKK